MDIPTDSDNDASQFWERPMEGNKGRAKANSKQMVTFFLQ